MFPHRLSFPSLRELSIAEFSHDKLEICGLILPSRDYLDILTHASCDSLTSLTLRPTFPNIFSNPECESFDEELLRRLTLHRNDAVCHHLTSLVIDYCVPTALCSALLNMVESRIKSHASQVPEESLHFLQLHLKNNTAELVKIGRRSTAVKELDLDASQFGFEDNLKASGNRICFGYHRSDCQCHSMLVS